MDRNQFPLTETLHMLTSVVYHRVAKSDRAMVINQLVEAFDNDGNLQQVNDAAIAELEKLDNADGRTCENCPLQRLADIRDRTVVRLTIWHEAGDGSDSVHATYQRDDRTESVTDSDVSGAVDKLLAAMKATT
jgi:hypothetical protein